MTKLKPNICRKCKIEMKYNWSDCDDLGNYEEWIECPKCGKTADVPKEAYSHD